MKMEAVYSSEILVPVNRTIGLNIPEDHNIVLRPRTDSCAGSATEEWEQMEDISDKEKLKMNKRKT
jgi:hypothetical protein